MLVTKMITNDDDEATRVESLYDSVKDLRKPLYKRSLDDNGNPTGPAKLLSIQDFIDDIDSGSVGSLVTIQGSFHYNSDAKSWIYSRNEMNYNNQSGIIGDGIESSSSTTESNTTESSSTTEDNDGTTQAKKKSELDLFDNEVALADDNTAKPSAKSDDKIDTSNYSKLAKSVKNVIIVGDQKAADTVSALKTQGATDKTLKNNKVYQFSATKANYAWFTGSDTGLSSVTKILSKDKKTKYTVVIYLSSADIGTKKQKEYRSNLASKINSLAKDYPNSDFVVVSATPVNESVKGVKVKNEDIKTYNKEFKAELQQSVSYVDVNGAMFANDKLADGFSFEKDGKNFTDTSLLKLFATVLDNSIETTTNSSDASSEDSTKTSETPIVTSSFQLSRLAHLLRPERYPNPKRLAQDLESKRFSIEQDPFFFINRKASEFGRTSTPNGHVIAVSPSPSQSECNCGGVKLFQICKGYGAVNQVQALEELVDEHRDTPGLIFISQGSIIEWVSANFKKNEIDFEVIDGETSIQDRTRITSRFASGDCKLVITSLTTALDLDCDYVVFYEFTVEVEQMIGRAHRGLGNKELDVYFIITENTPEVTYFMENIVPRCKLIEDILSKKNTAIEAVTRGLELEC